MKYKFVLIIYSSKRDRAGNSEYAFRATSTVNGKQIVGKISGGTSNILGAFYHLNGKEHIQNFYYSEQELAIRQFSYLVSDWPYLGSHPEELAKQICKVLRVRIKKSTMSKA